MNEIKAVSGAGLIGFLGETAAMGAAGFLGAAGALQYLSGVTAIPLIEMAIPREVYAAAGFIVGAAAMFGVVHQSTTTTSPVAGYNPYFF